MSTAIRPELSKKNPYYISRNRYYELKHFCLQYKEFKKAYNDLCDSIASGILKIENKDGAPKPDERPYIREKYLDNIILIETCCKLTDNVLWPYILKGVTEGLPYSYFKTNNNIPCGKDMYYDLYRKFFWILSHKKFA